MNPEQIREMKTRIEFLHLLLNNPQPGLATWTFAVSTSMDELWEHWTNPLKKV